MLIGRTLINCAYDQDEGKIRSTYEQKLCEQAKSIIRAERDDYKQQRWWFLGGGFAAGIAATAAILLLK